MTTDLDLCHFFVFLGLLFDLNAVVDVGSLAWRARRSAFADRRRWLQRRVWCVASDSDGRGGIGWGPFQNAR